MTKGIEGGEYKAGASAQQQAKNAHVNALHLRLSREIGFLKSSSFQSPNEIRHRQTIFANFPVSFSQGCSLTRCVPSCQRRYRTIPGPQKARTHGLVFIGGGGATLLAMCNKW